MGENTVTAVRSVTGAGPEVRAAPPGAQRGHRRLRSRQESNHDRATERGMA